MTLAVGFAVCGRSTEAYQLALSGHEQPLGVAAEFSDVSQGQDRHRFVLPDRAKSRPTNKRNQEGRQGALTAGKRDEARNDFPRLNWGR